MYDNMAKQRYQPPLQTVNSVMYFVPLSKVWIFDLPHADENKNRKEKEANQFKYNKCFKGHSLYFLFI